jgi:DNA-binding NarL/FixJ family response regulator
MSETARPEANRPEANRPEVDRPATPRPEASPSGTIRILIAEDHHIVRQGFVALLQSVDTFEVIAEASTGQQALDLFRQHRPDITLMDLRMPAAGNVEAGRTNSTGETIRTNGGVEAIQAIRREFPDARIIVLTTFDGDEDIFRAIQAGARGYLLKGMNADELIDAIQTVHRGKSRIPAAVAERLAERLSGNALTDRETEVLKNIVAGKSNKEIASALFISEATVKTHINNLLSKLGVTDRTQAATTALQRGIVHLD